MSSARRHRELLRTARAAGAAEAWIQHRGKHPALCGRCAGGGTFFLKFSDSPRAPSQQDKLLLRRVIRTIEEAGR